MGRRGREAALLPNHRPSPLRCHPPPPRPRYPDVVTQPAQAWLTTSRGRPYRGPSNVTITRGGPQETSPWVGGGIGGCPSF